MKTHVPALLSTLCLFSISPVEATEVAADSDWQPHNYTSVDGGSIVSTLETEKGGGFSISGGQTSGHGGIGVTYTKPIELQNDGFCLEFSLDRFSAPFEDNWFSVMLLDKETITNSANLPPVYHHWDDNARLAAGGSGLVILMRPRSDGWLELETWYVGVASASDATRTDGQWVSPGGGTYTLIKLPSFEHIKLCLIKLPSGGYNIVFNDGNFELGAGTARVDSDEGSINPHNKYALLDSIFPPGTPGYLKMAAKSLKPSFMKFTIHSIDGSPAEAKVDKEQAAVQGVYDLFRDVKFANGFNASGLYALTDGLSVKARFDYGDAEKKPAYRIDQWDTKYTLADKEQTRFSELQPGKYKIENPSKEITIDTNTGELGLKLIASTVYEKPRVYFERWPCLLIEDYQMYEASGSKFAYKLKNLSQLRFQIKMKLVEYEDKMGKAADPKIHATMFFAYLYVTGMNNKGLSEMIWFGFPLFDNRYAFSGVWGKQDGDKDDASPFFIYNIPTRDFTDKTFHNAQGVPVGSEDNPWISVDFDVLPHIQKALEAAQSQGFMQGLKVEDLYINGMNMGWENPGTYDSAMVIKDLALKSFVK